MTFRAMAILCAGATALGACAADGQHVQRNMPVQVVLNSTTEPAEAVATLLQRETARRAIRNDWERS